MLSLNGYNHLHLLYQCIKLNALGSTEFYEKASIEELNELEGIFDNILKDGYEDKLMLFAEKYLISKDQQYYNLFIGRETRIRSKP